MKQIISAVLLITIICSVLLFSIGCQEEKPAEPKSLEEAHSILYNWLIDNGKLSNGTTLTYTNNNLTICTDSSQTITVQYKAISSDGYNIVYELPLFSSSEKIAVRITLSKKITALNTTGEFAFDCFIFPATYRKNTPLSYERVYTSPYQKTIRLNEYGSTRYEDGKMIFTLDPDKADEYYALKKYNQQIDDATDRAEQTAIEYSHSGISELLSLLESYVCKSAGLTLSDLGYKEFAN